MPTSVTNITQAGTSYETPLKGPSNHVVSVRVNIANLTVNEIDSDGVLRPGVPLTRAGALVGVAPAFVYGVTPFAFKLPIKDNSVANRVGTFDVPVATICMVNRDIAEDVLGRAYTADEVAGFDRAGSKCVLID